MKAESRELKLGLPESAVASLLRLRLSRQSRVLEGDGLYHQAWSSLLGISLNFSSDNKMGRKPLVNYRYTSLYAKTQRGISVGATESETLWHIGPNTIKKRSLCGNPLWQDQLLVASVFLSRITAYPGFH
jgi:hypothetical protein